MSEVPGEDPLWQRAFAQALDDTPGYVRRRWRDQAPAVHEQLDATWELFQAATPEEQMLIFADLFANKIILGAERAQQVATAICVAAEASDVVGAGSSTVDRRDA